MRTSYFIFSSLFLSFWAILGGACKQSEQSAKLIPGSWKYQSSFYSVGPYQIQWEGAALGSARLLVYLADKPKKTIWSTLPGMAFVGLARAKAKLEQSAAGNFSIKDQIQERCQDQSIDQILSRKGSLLMKGVLVCPKIKLPYRFYFRQSKEGHLRIEFSFAPQSQRGASSTPSLGWNRSYLIYSSDPDEAFYGFGMQFGAFNMKGRRLAILAREKNIGIEQQSASWLGKLLSSKDKDWHSSLAAVPHYISSRMRSLCLENYEYSIFDMQKTDRLRIKVFSPRLRARLLPGDSPLELIESYTKFAGRMQEPPDWLMRGGVVSFQKTEPAKILSLNEKLLSLRAAPSAYLLQDWQGLNSSAVDLFTEDSAKKKRFLQEWKNLKAILKSQNIALLAYNSPLLLNKASVKQKSGSSYQIAKRKNYLVKNKKGEPYLFLSKDVLGKTSQAFEAGLLDLSNPKARAWAKARIRKRLLHTGFQGWMADHGAGSPMSAAQAYTLDKDNAFIWSSRYAEAWSKLNFQILKSSGQAKELVFFTCAASLKSPQYNSVFCLGKQVYYVIIHQPTQYNSVFCLGKQEVSWSERKGMKSAILGLLSGGISGFSINHVPIGGYVGAPYLIQKNYRSKELLFRWLEWGAFTAVMRTHEGL